MSKNASMPHKIIWKIYIQQKEEIRYYTKSYCNLRVTWISMWVGYIMRMTRLGMYIL